MFLESTDANLEGRKFWRASLHVGSCSKDITVLLNLSVIKFWSSVTFVFKQKLPASTLKVKAAAYTINLVLSELSLP